MGKDTFVNSQAPDPFEARVGTVVSGKWTLTSLIGVGGMASVYEARHEIGRREAIKILHAEIARQPELRKRFEQEAYAVNRLSHRGVVQIRDIGVSSDGCPFLVMELLDGQTLAAHMLAQSLSADTALNHIDELLDVLVEAHREGIVHRDLKPDNLFITASGQLKVLDFGIARVRAGSAMKVVTQTGTALGTPSYMPPEQITGIDVNHRADLFAVGAIVWELLTGRDIHEASSHQQRMVKMLTTPAPPLLSVAPHVGEPIARVVDRALTFEAKHRYPDAKTMQSDLREARAGRPPPFALAAPVSNDHRSTAAHTPNALATDVAMAASAAPSSAVASSAVPMANSAVANSAVANGPVANGAVANSAVANGAVANGAVANGAVPMANSAPPSHAGPHVGAVSSALPASGQEATTNRWGAGVTSSPPAGASPISATVSGDDDRQRKVLIAIVFFGTLLGALATVVTLRMMAGDSESSDPQRSDSNRASDDGAGNDEEDEDDDEARNVLPSPAGPSQTPRSPPSSAQSSPAEPSPAEPSPAEPSPAEPSPAEPQPPRPVPTPLKPAPPKTAPKPTPDPRVDPLRLPIPPLPTPGKDGRRKKKKKKPKKKKKHDDD